MAERDALHEQLVLTDLVNRVLDRGVSVIGDVVISVAGVDLVHLGLRLDLAAVEPPPPRTINAQLAAAARARTAGPEGG
jgi:hypothetical protein